MFVSLALRYLVEDRLNRRIEINHPKASCEMLSVIEVFSKRDRRCQIISIPMDKW